ncbi:MAG: HIT domain-containing protein [Candidatus Omnitrophica bacterium]|nr:HIT domain-containing protein [Candidatus Omnitrophota bacterium]
MDRLWAPWRSKYILSTKPQKCIFCVSAKGSVRDDLKRFILYRSTYSMILLNKYPYNNGHVMVAPYRHVDGFDHLGDDALIDMMRMVNKAKRLLDSTLKPHGYNIGANISRTAGAGFDQHVHMHVVPRWNGDTNFMPVLNDAKVISESLEALYGRLKGKLC